MWPPSPRRPGRSSARASRFGGALDGVVSSVIVLDGLAHVLSGVAVYLLPRLHVQRCNVRYKRTIYQILCPQDMRDVCSWGAEIYADAVRICLRNLEQIPLGPAA